MSACPSKLVLSQRPTAEKDANRMETYSSLGKAISEHLDCGVCHGRLQDPRILDCKHTFCLECMNGVIEITPYPGISSTNRLSCPVCRVQMVCTGASTLRSNFIVNNILETLANEENERLKKDFCEKHPLAEKTLFCEKCLTILCSKCAIHDHGKHSHRVHDLVEFSQKRTGSMVDLLRKAATWTESQENCMKVLVEKTTEGNNEFDRLNRDVFDTFSVRMQHIKVKAKASREMILKDIAAKRASFNKEMDKVLQRQEDAMSHVIKSTGLAEELLDSPDPKEIVVIFDGWAKTLKNDLKYKAPDLIGPRRQVNSVKALRLVEEPNSIEESFQLGSIQKRISKSKDAKSTQVVKEVSLRRPEKRLRLKQKVVMSGKVKTMTVHPMTGGVVVGYRNGHMEIIEPNGSRQKVTTNISARDVAVLSDGRFAALTGCNIVKIYSSGGTDQEGGFACEPGDYADAVAVDSKDRIMVLFPRPGMICVLTGDGFQVIERQIQLQYAVSSGVSEMRCTESGKILIVADGGVLTFNIDGSLNQKLPTKESERASCDPEENLWVLSHQKYGLSTEMFIEIYDRDGRFKADLHVPTDPKEGRGFEPWGIAVSHLNYAAQISPTELAWFIYE